MRVKDRAVGLDLECVYDEGVYARLIREFAENSFGTFRPTDVDETREDEGGATVVHVSFRNRRKKYEFIRPLESDWLEDDFFHLLDRAMAAARTPLRFIAIPGSGQVKGLTQN